MQTLVAEILAAWRRAERLSSELPPGSPEQVAALAACQRLKLIYRELTGHGVSEPPTEIATRSVLAEIARDLTGAA